MSNNPVILFDSYGPYHIARVNAASRNIVVNGLELCSISREYGWTRDSSYIKFPLHQLFEESEAISATSLKFRLRRLLDNLNPSVVFVPGWSGKLSFAAVKWAIKRNIPLVVMSESTKWDTKRTLVKEWIKKKYVAVFSSALVGGKPHREYIEELGMESSSIFDGYDAVDNEYFVSKTDDLRTSHDFNINKNTKPPYFLASARFVPKKNLTGLLKAYSRYLQLVAASPYSNSPWKLLLLGDGPLRVELLTLAQQLGILDHVTFCGFQQYESLPRYFAFASAFIHASSTEQWGLVVNEAMASGLPVIVSTRCGCVYDLVRVGVNGWVFDPYDLDFLARLMMRATSMKEQDTANSLDVMGIASREIISEWDTNRFASGFESAMTYAVNKHNQVKRISLGSRLVISMLGR
jgi:1,2-diacylglycerol 3-alpha-glucosyltransferase